jgi:hypothetical protein
VSWSVAACLQKGSASPLLRRSSLSLLTEIGPVRETLPQLKTLMADEDPKIALLACKLRLTQAPADSRREIVERGARRYVGDWEMNGNIAEITFR